MTQSKAGSGPFIAVVGSGYWGKNLVRNYHQLGALRQVCDRDEQTLAFFKEQYPEVDICLALNDVLAREDVDGVAIATPAETHFAIAREALLAGKHVYVEKPLVLEEKEGEELIRLADERNRVLMVGHLLHYHPAFVRLKEMAAAGDLGRINYIYSHRLNLGKIRREENILWSFAPHDISMILSLAGEEPESVYATGANYLHKKIADVTTTHLEFPSGIKAHVFVSWLHPYKEQNLVVVGDRRMAVFNDTLPWPKKLCLYPHQIKWEKNIPVPSKAEPDYVALSEKEPLRSECKHFLRCMETGQNPRTDGKEGLQVLRILKASQRSMDRLGAQFAFDPSEMPPDEPSCSAHREYFAHSSAVIDDDVAIGPGSKVWHFSHILPRSRIGDNCNIGQNVAIGPDVSIGKGCKIQNNVSIYKGVTLEDFVFCGPSMVFTNVYNPRAEIKKMNEVRPTRVKIGATIGANAVVVCGTTIGRYAFVGAGSVVTRNVADHALVVGNPARQIGWACRCGERLPDDLACLACTRTYRRTEDGIGQAGRND